MVVRESPGVHEGPALPWGSDGAVVTQEATTPALGDGRRQRRLGPSPTPMPGSPCAPPPRPAQLLGTPCEVTATAA